MPGRWGAEVMAPSPPGAAGRQIVPRRLPIFIAEGSFEKDYEVHYLPQMFIIDPRERIRFRLEDLLEENYFQESLDWMIEAARR